MSKRSRSRMIDHPIGKGKAMEKASWMAGFNKVPGTIFLGQRESKVPVTIFFVFTGSLTGVGRDEMILR